MSRKNCPSRLPLPGTLLACLLSALLAGCGGGSGTVQPAPQAPADISPYTPSPSSPDSEEQPTPPTPATIVPKSLSGSFEFGQTQVVGQNETRHAPKIAEGRNTLLMFTPETPIATTANVFVEAKANGVSLGRYYLAQPDKLPGFVDDRLSPTDLTRLSTSAWSVLMPAGWIRPDVTLSVGYDDTHPEENTVDAWRIETALPTLAAPVAFTVARAKFLLWGESNHNMDTVSAPKLTRDYFASLPVATLRTVDYAPARWDYAIVNPSNGAPAKASSAPEHTALGGGSFYGLLKQWSIMASMANTGRGLLTSVYGDSSPYSYGTYVGQGKYRNANGDYADMDDGGVAGGWTGWSAIWWGSDCSNGFIHEVGHSLTLAHFTGGTAQSWGIGSEYPLDGVYLPTHPQPFDTVRGAFRTWYRVNGGPVAGTSADGLDGKHDPMNGGESSNSQTCFPPYTAYHAEKAQNWMNNTPTFLNLDGQAGIYRWDAAASRYVSATPATNALTPERVNVPVATLIGTIAAASSPDARQIYPAMLAQSGNTFVMPDPFQSGLPSLYNNARYFVEVVYANGKRAYTLIPQTQITDPDKLVHFSMNVALDDRPVQATLYESAQPYPAITLAGSTALFTRPIDTQQPVPDVVTLGKDSMRQQSEVTLTSVCTQKTCRRDSVDVAWYPQDGTRLYFTAQDATVGATSAIANPEGKAMQLSVPMTGPDGAVHAVQVRASRTVNTADGYRALPANDNSPAPVPLQGNLQRLVLWVDSTDNPDLPTGTYTTAAPVKLDVHTVNDAGDTVVDEVSVNARIILPKYVDAGIDAPVYHGYTVPQSSVFFTTPDNRQGPTSGIWSYASAETLVRAFVRDTLSGTQATAVFRAQRLNCGLGGSRFSMNAAGYYGLGCEDGVQLRFVAADNPDLFSGHRYVTDHGNELVIDATGWHRGGLQERLAFRWDFVMP